MADLSTTYMGLTLRSPIVVSSNPLTMEIENLRQMEESGASAIVLYSLFEEQISLAELGYRSYYERHESELPEGLRHIARMPEYNQGAGGYLAHVYQAKQVLKIPVIASLNGYYSSGWTRYARLIEAAGADALELNIYYLATKPNVTGVEVEQMYIDLVRDVTQTVRIPVAIKLNPFFSATANIARRLVSAGADALVLFNRFYQPDFDIESRTIIPSLDLSHPSELRQRLRWVALLSGRIDADLAVTGGVHSAEDVLKSVMAGAAVAMMASAVIKNGIGYLSTVTADLQNWLDNHAIESLPDIRSCLSQVQIGDSDALERANYLNVLRSNRN
jgi:dihydroorotate dehydrogenase (fumarate)